VVPVDIALRKPTLDDVFLTLTGHRAEEHPDETEAVGTAAGGGPGGVRP